MIEVIEQMNSFLLKEGSIKKYGKITYFDFITTQTIRRKIPIKIQSQTIMTKLKFREGNNTKSREVNEKEP